MPQLLPPLDAKRRIKLAPHRPSSGGAANDRAPASFGHPPQHIEARIFVPPQLAVLNPAPKLVLAAALDAPPSLTTEGPLGDPAGLGKLLSGGNAGIGDGAGHRFGTGSGGSVYQAGRGGVTAPVPIHRVEPEYSEEARKAHAMGAVLVLAEVGPDGRVHNARVARSIGLGLDEKALEAVSQWLFRPGTKDGKPVTVAAQIEVAFHLL